jgi:hypothetical protein
MTESLCLLALLLVVSPSLRQDFLDFFELLGLYVRTLFESDESVSGGITYKDGVVDLPESTPVVEPIEVPPTPFDPALEIPEITTPEVADVMPHNPHNPEEPMQPEVKVGEETPVEPKVDEAI